MKTYVKNFRDFINESIKHPGEIKSEELWNESGKNMEEYEKLVDEYIKTIDVEGFMKYFADVIESELPAKLMDTYEYEDYHKDEDGYVVGGVYSSKDVYFEYDFNDKDNFGEYGIGITWDGSNVKRQFTVYVLCGDTDITDTEFGQALQELFEKIYDICDEEAKNDFELSVQDEREIENTYLELSRGLAAGAGGRY